MKQYICDRCGKKFDNFSNWYPGKEYCVSEKGFGSFDLCLECKKNLQRWMEYKKIADTDLAQFDETPEAPKLTPDEWLELSRKAGGIRDKFRKDANVEITLYEMNAMNLELNEIKRLIKEGDDDETLHILHVGLLHDIKTQYDRLTSLREGK